MINKKNLLGKKPDEFGVKDAIHVAIVSVRAGRAVKPGERCKMNEHGEAVPGDGPGVADPFRKGTILSGDSFWLMLDLSEVPNVRHDWELKSCESWVPKRDVQKNRTLVEIADSLGVTYEQLMDGCKYVVEHDASAPYPGTFTEEQFDDAINEIAKYELWSEWGDEACYEWENDGSACCPEPVHPYDDVFYFKEKSGE